MKKILIVEDDSFQRNIIKHIIDRAGFRNEIMEASDGEEGIQVLAKNFQDVALVLCDLNMPKMTGFEFIEGVAKVSSVANIPIVMVTSEDSEEKMKQAHEAHPNLAGYIVKPFTPEKVKAVIAPILKKQKKES